MGVGTTFFGCCIPDINSDIDNQEVNPINAKNCFEQLKPKASPFPLIRIGDGSDGSYLIPDDLEGVSGCLSPGVNNFKHFEDELATHYGITSDMLDGSSDLEKLATPLIKGMQTFSKLWLDCDDSENSISIHRWLASKPDHEKDFILQMDIEGAEYRNILTIDAADLKRFRIIILELHRLAAGFTRPRIFNHVLKPFLAKLSTDFICVHAHPNNASYAYTPPSLGIAVPSILEITLLRKDRLEGSNKLHKARIPHPLDITSVPGRIPLTLSKDWLETTRPATSRLKIARDWIHLYKVHHRQGNATNLATGHAKRIMRDLLQK